MITKSSSALAKQYGLERYLDRPDELNRAIFNLLLQETIQAEKARERKETGQASMISVKRAAGGRFLAGCVR